MTMELFTAKVCPYAHRTRLVLHEKGLDFEHIEIDFDAKPERFLAVSPYGKVPALVVDDKAIYESLVINEWLDETYPDPPLMPADPYLRAQVRIWAHHCDAYFNKDYYAVLKNVDPSTAEELAEALNTRFRYIEQEGFGRLSGDGPYWLGADVSLLDFAWHPYFERLPAWTHYRGFDIPADCPRIAAWRDAMAARDSSRRVANDRDYYIANYANYAKQVMAA